MKRLFPQFDVDYISGVMSLRRPQKTSLKRLADILEEVPLTKDMPLDSALETVNNLFPICKDFERNFISLTFALATGVGKTRLMGAFITYLYCQYGYRNFFVVAPNLTIYNKLKSDLGDPGSKKYVFKGCSCFAARPPRVYADDEYRQKPLDFAASDVNLFVFNIDKFNSLDASMRKFNEYLGKSFFNQLANLDDLVMLMDESHHYRAKSGMQALNELRPILGLELTATPLINSGSRQIPFKNVVYEYPLSKAISDGYTRTPFAIGRSDMDFYKFGDEQIDKIMLLDGIKCHERVKTHLELYAKNNNRHIVKPFMLVVCKDTDHAKTVLDFIQSKEFRDGKYASKTITVHSKQTGVERDENVRLLLDVEQPDNPIEIVIHVNVLKEGWDVNNLFTIVPLRTATSKVLREQTVGRGLRLPYGERTGDKIVDAVYLTAHDKFAEVIAEAQSGDSIFKAGNVIKIDPEETEEQVITTQPALPFPDQKKADVYAKTGIEQNDKNDAVIDEIIAGINCEVIAEMQKSKAGKLSDETKKKIANKVAQKVSENKDLADIYNGNADPFYDWISHEVTHTVKAIADKYIPIPRIKVTDEGTTEYIFGDFELDLSDFNHVPVGDDLLIQNLQNIADRVKLEGEKIDFGDYNPLREIVFLLREKPEIDYEACSELLFKLISATYNHFFEQFGENGAKNIVMMHRHDIADKIYSQMMQHFSCSNSLLKEEVIGVTDTNIANNYSYASKQSIWDKFDSCDEHIKSVLFTDISKGVFAEAKFDSKPELILAKILEYEPNVKNWLRPAKMQFNITYNRGKRYEPDFVVETDDTIYLVEVKGEDKLNDPDVIAKKKRGIQYCQVATNWGKANGYKAWRYLFIPSMQIKESSTFGNLSKMFAEK
jgi:possible type III restriction protein res subunit